MNAPVVDTDVLIRLLTNDDPRKQDEAAGLFERVERGEVQLQAPYTVIADAVYVLSSPRLYRVPRDAVAAMLTALVRLPSFRVQNRPLMLRALAIYGAEPIDFGDAMVVATAELAGASGVVSYDGDFDRIASVRRLEPPDVR
jgi:predicted nucleic acid-binding protein